MKRATRLGFAILAVLAVGGAAIAALPVTHTVQDWPDRILMTNDDGIDTPGIRALAESLAEDAEVFVVAPAGNRSGSGSYVGSLSEPMSIEERDWGGVTAFSVSGFPADAAMWGLKELLMDAPPDLFISGINDGPNAGGAWLVSGTIGAARIAAFFGVPSLAVSGYDRDDPEAIRQVAAWLAELVKSQMVRGLEPGEYLLVNMPAVRMEAVTGVVVAPLDLETLTFGAAREESGAWRTTLGFGREPGEGGDWGSLRERRIVITPMRIGEMQALDPYREMLDGLPDPASIGSGR